MVYEGFQRYGGTEVVNHERLAQYVRAGIVPTGLSVEVPEGCDGLAGVVTADGEYRTPLQDEAPWVDLDNPDTWDFAGVLSLDITGLDDSTRTVAMTETVRDGALPGRARRGPRTVAQTALLVGRTTEGVYAGLAWLERVLHGSCDQLDAECGPAATLEVFTTCPGPIVTGADTSLPPTVRTYLHPNDPVAPDYVWSASGGIFDTPADGATRADGGTLLLPYPPDGYDGGTLTNVPEVPPLDGGGADPLDAVISGGTAADLPGDALLVGPRAMCSSGPVRITWRLRTEEVGLDETRRPISRSVQLVIVDDSGTVVEFGPKVDLTNLLEDYTWDLPFGVDHDTWQPGIAAAFPTVVRSVTTSIYPDSSPLDCVTPYQRFLPRTATVSGPTVVEQVDAGCAVLLKVEWTWVVGTPYRYGATKTVLSGLSAELDPTLVLPGVSWHRTTADPPPVVVDTCDTTTGWTANRNATLVASGGSIYVTGREFPPTVTRTGNIDVSTRRYITIDGLPTPVYYVPALAVTDTLGLTAAAPVAGAYIGDSGLVRFVFAVPSSIGATVNKLSWSQSNGEASDVVLQFTQVATQTVVRPAPAVIPATPWNCAPPAPELSCAADPCSPGFVLPPALPYISDPNRPRITTQLVRDVWACVGPEQTPGNDGVFTLTLTAGVKPIVGARVRVWDDVDGGCAVDDPCGFAYEYLIDYVPAGGVLTIDGVDSTITTLCDGGAVLADASGSVAGSYGGPTEDPVARCNRRYLIRVQWLSTYPRTCEGFYTAGQAQGDLTLAVGVTTREG